MYSPTISTIQTVSIWLEKKTSLKFREIDYSRRKMARGGDQRVTTIMIIGLISTPLNYTKVFRTIRSGVDCTTLQADSR